MTEILYFLYALKHDSNTYASFFFEVKKKETRPAVSCYIRRVS
jgi:hypothetical protein